MRHFTTRALTLLFALAFGVSLAQAGEVGEENNVILHYEILFDGYCDGMTIDINTADGIAAGVWTSPCATCPFDNLVGGTTGNVIGPLGYTTNVSPGHGTLGDFDIFTRLNANGTWTHYFLDGSTLNSGTFSLCAAGVVADDNAVPSVAPAGFERE